MKILFVNKFLYPRGGAESYVLKLGEYLKSQGHLVAYFGMYDSQNTVGNDWNLYTKNVDFHSGGLEKLLYPFRIIYSREAYRKFSLLLDKFRPDVVHLNNINFQITPSVIDAAWKKKIPVVQTVHDSQMVCPGHLLYDSKRGEVCEKCVHGSKWNCVRGRCIHGSLLKSLIGTAEGFFYDRRSTYDKVRLYICPSSFMERILHSRGRYRGKTRVLCNYIQMTENEIFEKKGYVLYFGRLSEEKGIRLFLKLCRKYPGLQFKIAGSGPLEEECRNISNVDFLGMLTGEKLNRTIGEASLVVYPSICYENCPLSVLEAISLGTPVLASPRGGVRELIEAGKSGILVKEPFCMETLAETFEKLVSQPARLTKMSRYCREIRHKFLTIEKYAEELEKIYEDCNDRP